MAILDLYTQNSDVSWVIRKNPLTQSESGQPFMRKVRQGVAYGWYAEPQHFRLWFKEGNNQSSFYKHLDNNYLDQSSYNCPYVYCALINEMLSSTVKECHEKDIVCDNRIELSGILITLPNVAQFFTKYFAGSITIDMQLLAKKAYRVVFSGNVSLYKLLNLVQVFCLMQSLEDRNIYIDLSVSTINKYATALKNIDAPYFIVYLFLSRCVSDSKTFNEVKTSLQQSNWQLFYGNTQKQRFDQIKAYMQPGELLHDIGCGELYYSRHFAPLYSNIVAWDADEAIQQRNALYLEKKSLKNIQLRGAFSGADITHESDLLITEMLEHMPKEDATDILKTLKEIAFRRLVITVPNSDFNQFYQLDGSFRHDDHYWEPSYAETVTWINSIFDKHSVKIIQVGDGIDNIHVSTMAVIERV